MPVHPHSSSIFDDGPNLSLQVDFQPEVARGMIKSHPFSEQIRWWQALLDPEFDRRTATSDPGREQYIRTEQVVNQYRAVVQGSKAARKRFDQGEITVADIMVTTMLDEIPLSEGDLIVRMGREFAGTINPDLPLLAYKEVLTRGMHSTAGAGTISSAGTAVTGVGTAFTTFFSVGDIIEAAGRACVISAIASNTSLTLHSAPAQAWDTNEYTKRYELMKFPHVYKFSSVRSLNTTYTNAHYKIGSDYQTIKWLVAATQPAYESQFSVMYWHAPRYIVRPDLGVHRHTFRGLAMQSVIARLWEPQNHTR